jgi:hypothetical protein
MYDVAEAYAVVMGRWSRQLVPLFVEFVGVRDGERVLDVGCGTGSRYAGLLEKTRSELPDESKRRHRFGPNPHQLPACFRIPLDHREHVENVFSFPRGFLEASGLYLYAMRKAETEQNLEQQTPASRPSKPLVTVGTTGAPENTREVYKR